MRHPVARNDVATRPSLSETDVKILRLIADGATNQGISRALGVSTATIGRRLTTLFEKLGAKDRTHATVIALAGVIIRLNEVKLPTWVRTDLDNAEEAARRGG